MQLGTVLGASVWRRPGRAPRGLALIGDSPSIRIADKGRTRIRQCLVRRPTRIPPHMRRGPGYQSVTGRLRMRKIPHLRKYKPNKKRSFVKLTGPKPKPNGECDGPLNNSFLTLALTNLRNFSIS
mgnify:CR=1 FL=1